MTFYLGTHMPVWLERVSVPLFVSAIRMRRYLRRGLKATCRWALDSGGFSELRQHGRWTVSPEDYAAEARRWSESVGGMDWAAIQDWMCEPEMLARTGKTVHEHQRRTVDSFHRLTALAPELPWVPVLQGWRFDDYLDHAAQWMDSGIDLAAVHRVGVGSICRRQDTGFAEELLSYLHGRGIRLHAFGAKFGGLVRSAAVLSSADSLAWSYNGRKNHRTVVNGANSMEHALGWRQRLVEECGRERVEKQCGFGW